MSASPRHDEGPYRETLEVKRPVTSRVYRDDRGVDWRLYARRNACEFDPAEPCRRCFRPAFLANDIADLDDAIREGRSTPPEAFRKP